MANSINSTEFRFERCRGVSRALTSPPGTCLYCRRKIIAGAAKPVYNTTQPIVEFGVCCEECDHARQQ